MTEERKPPPGEYSRFKELLDKIAKVPKQEVDENAREFKEERLKPQRKAR